MTDSSEDEDLSRFQEAVDDSFIRKINAESTKKICIVSEDPDNKPRSIRYLDEATHYNDIKVSKELQNKIGAKVSEIINRNLKFINVQDTDVKKQTVNGGVKLFSDSAGMLSCEDAIDTFTEKHNKLSRQLQKRKQCTGRNSKEIDEAVYKPKEHYQQDSGTDHGSTSANSNNSIRLNEKVKSVAISGDYILSKEETKCWKSRRKEKVYKYRGKGVNNVLTSVE